LCKTREIGARGEEVKGIRRDAVKQEGRTNRKSPFQPFSGEVTQKKGQKWLSGIRDSERDSKKKKEGVKKERDLSANKVKGRREQTLGWPFHSKN